MELYLSSPLCLSGVDIVNFAVYICQEILRLLGDMRIGLSHDSGLLGCGVRAGLGSLRSTSVAETTGGLERHAHL